MVPLFWLLERLLHPLAKGLTTLTQCLFADSLSRYFLKGIPHGWGGMLTQPETGAKSVFKNPLLYSSIVLIVVALAVGWVFFSRWEQTRSFERRETEKRTEQQQEQDRITLEQMGGKELAIQNFYASAGVIRRGQSVQLCYGVANATSVKLEPQPNPVWPSYARCVNVTPSGTTTYTITIADAAGNTKSQGLEVKVH